MITLNICELKIKFRHFIFNFNFIFLYVVATILSFIIYNFTIFIKEKNYIIKIKIYI